MDRIRRELVGGIVTGVGPTIAGVREEIDTIIEIIIMIIIMIGNFSPPVFIRLSVLIILLKAMYYNNGLDAKNALKPFSSRHRLDIAFDLEKTHSENLGGSNSMLAYF